jgi:Arc/MetJ-type ribon-helix-helix transcriptional regulator
MQNEYLPKSNLQRLQKEVLVLPPTAALPVNLPDHWLHMIARYLEEAVGSGEFGDNSSYIAAPLALIIRILEGKTPNQQIEISIDALYSYFCDLRIEINLEIVSRKSELKVEPATLDTIFSDRDVKIFTQSG